MRPERLPPLPPGPLAARATTTALTRPGAALTVAVLAAVAVVGGGAGGSVTATGMALGLLTGASGAGLALAWRTSGAVPFAHVAIGAAPTTAALTLTADGVLPWPAAVTLAVLLAAGFGGGTYLVAVRPFRGRPPLAPTVALLAVATGLAAVAAFAPRWLSDRLLPPATVPGPLHDRWVTVAGVAVRGDVAVVALLAVIGLGGIILVLRRTSGGVLLAATADEPMRAALLGVPVNRVAALAWMSAGALAALAAVGRATVVGLPVGLTATAVALVTPLAAVAVAGPQRLGGVTIAGVGLGVVQHGLLASRLDPAVVDLLLVGVLFAAITWRRVGEREPSRTRGSGGSVPASPNPAAVGMGVVGVGLAGLMLLGAQGASVVTLAVVTAFGALSLVVTIGWTGVLWLGHVAVAAVGGATAAVLASAGLDILACLALGACAGGGTAAVLLRPTVGVPGLATAVTTLAVAAAAPPVLLGVALGDTLAGATLPPPHLLGWVRLDERGLAVVAVLALACAAAAVAHLRRTRTARLLIAVRDDVELARACAARPAKLRLVGTALGGALAGAAGALRVLWTGAATPDVFPPSDGITVLVAAVVGGIGSPVGGLAGAVLVVLAHELLPGAWPFAFDAALVLLALRMSPGGIVELRRPRRRRPLPRRPRARHGEPAPPGLVCRDLVAGYGAAAVLKGVDLTVAPGEIVGIVGRNGVGKTTLLSVLAGVVPVDGGAVSVAGRLQTSASVEQRVRQGLRYVPADRPVLPSLTPGEHVALARRAGMAVENNPGVSGVQEHIRAGALSGGEQRRLAVHLGLQGTPRAVLLDEPTLGLEPEGREVTQSAIRAAAAAGAAVVVVESSVALLAPIADRIVALEEGRLTAWVSGSPSPHSRARAPSIRCTATPPVLTLKDVSARRGETLVLRDVGLQISAGEAVALLGGNGAGKTTLVDVAAGAVPAERGTVSLQGQDVTAWTANRRAAAGLSRAFQTPRAFAGLTVAEALSVGRERLHPLPDHLADVLGVPAARRAQRETDEHVDELIELLGLRQHRARRTADLSLGWRRRVALGIAIASEPVALLLDEPSAGLDAEHRAALPTLLREVIAHTGCALLIAEHDTTVAGAVADRSLRLTAGRLQAVDE